jgi:carboxymethylenebutenolidase
MLKTSADTHCHDTVTDAHGLLNATGAETAPSRRTALKTALGVGYAATVGAAIAQTAIKTSADGLTVGEVLINVDGFGVPAYRAAPEGKRNAPVVLVIQEVFGVHEYIADTARRFAKAGYMAIAPELYARQGDPGKYNAIADLIREIVNKVPDAQVMKDLDGVVKWAAANGGDTSKLGVTGFCWGGRITWLYAAHNPAVKAGVAWYGRLVGQPNDLMPTNPMDLVGKINGPVLGLYGGADTGIPLDTVEKMKGALAGGSAAAKKSEFMVYDGAPHAFHADYRPSYRKDPADDGWKRCVEWFKKNGVA